jgi:hypothetical protein
MLRMHYNISTAKISWARILLLNSLRSHVLVASLTKTDMAPPFVLADPQGSELSFLASPGTLAGRISRTLAARLAMFPSLTLTVMFPVKESLST